jgi:LysM repeat protein
MKSPSPFVPQGSNLEQHQQNQARSSLRVKIFCAIGVNVLILLVLLMQGCKREQPPIPDPGTDMTGIYGETNPPSVDPGFTDTNYNAGMTDPGTNSGMGLQPVEPVPVPLPVGTEYKIQKGDTFSSIAPKFNTSVKALQAANPNVDATKLQINQVITIPPPSATPPPALPVVNAGTGETVYTVKSGDNLSRIAAQFGTKVEAIKTANGLTTDRIKVGDKLKIPAK